MHNIIITIEIQVCSYKLPSVLKYCSDAPELISGHVNIELDIDITRFECTNFPMCSKHCSDAPESISEHVNTELKYEI